MGRHKGLRRGNGKSRGIIVSASSARNKYVKTWGLSHLNKCGSLLTWKKQTVSDRIIRSSRRQSASYFFRTTTSVAYSVFVFFRLPRTNEFRVFRSVSFGEDYLCSERWPSARFRRRHSPVPDTGIVGRLRLLSKVRTRLQPEYCD